MLTFSWLCVSRDLLDPFIPDSQCSCPCWWSSFIQNRDGYVQIITEIHSHSMCLCNLSCPNFHEGLFLWWCVCVCVCVENVRTTSVSCLCVCVCVCKFVCLCWGVSQNVRNWVCVYGWCVRVCVCVKEPVWSCLELLQTETVPVLFDDILLLNYDWLCTNDYLVLCDMVLIYCKQWLLLS
jgi:hypothetical protein